MQRFLLSMGLLGFTAPAWAEEAAHGGGGGKLPQFQAEYFAGQIFWLAVSFVLLYLLLQRVALPRIAATQTARRAQREADLVAAAKANDRAKQIISDYEKSLATARQQAQAKLAAITQTAQAEAAQRQQAQQQQLQQKLADAERTIASGRAQALGQVRDAAVDVAQTMVERLTGVTTNAAAVVDRLRRDAA